MWQEERTMMLCVSPAMHRHNNISRKKQAMAKRTAEQCQTHARHTHMFQVYTVRSLGNPGCKRVTV
jgi:hypothetical protein